MSGQLVEQWPFKRLSDVCSFQGGSQPPKSNFIQEPKQGYVRLLQIRDFTSDSKAVYIPEDLAKRRCEKNDIMIGRYGASVGQIHRGKEGSYNVALIKTIPDLNLINRDYFYYYLQSPLFQEPLRKVSARAAQAGFSKGDISDFKIPLPSLEKQQRIVSILNEAFRNIDDNKQHVELKAESGSELLQSIVDSVFSENGDGWIDTTLGDISEIIMGQSPKGDTYNSEGFGVPLINGPVEFGPDPFSKTLKTKFTTAPTKMCEINDLILCVRGSTTGRMNIAGHESCIGRGVAAIRSNEYQGWINHFINFNRNHIYSLGTGATFPNISKDSITKIRITIPPDNERKLLVSKLQNISFEINLLDSKLTQELNSLEELKQSILREAFNGTL
jgi:type I restriction enzyme, S subunit